MKEISAYQCADGTIHSSEASAKAHDDDLLGEELDGFLLLLNLDITRTQQHKALLRVMADRPRLLKCLMAIVDILEFDNEQTHEK